MGMIPVDKAGGEEDRITLEHAELVEVPCLGSRVSGSDTYARYDIRAVVPPVKGCYFQVFMFSEDANVSSEVTYYSVGLVAWPFRYGNNLSLESVTQYTIESKIFPGITPYGASTGQSYYAPFYGNNTTGEFEVNITHRDTIPRLFVLKEK